MLLIHRTTTAEFRSMAQKAEDLLAWDSAAELWDAALEAYPADLMVRASAQEDVRRITARRDECRRLAGGAK